MVSEYRLDGLGFEFVVEWRGGAVGVHIPELAQWQSGIVNGRPHGPRCALTLGGRSGHMMGIRRCAVTDDLRQGRGAALPRVLELLEYQDSRSFPHHEAVALGIERPGGPGWFVITSGHRLHGAKSRERNRGHGRFGAPRDHHFRLGVLDDPERLAN